MSFMPQRTLRSLSARHVAQLRHPTVSCLLSSPADHSCLRSKSKEPFPMARRWFVPLASMGLIFGSMLLAAGTASAAPTATHATVHVSAYKPGGLMIRPAGGAQVSHVLGHTTATSTNWSG